MKFRKQRSEYARFREFVESLMSYGTDSLFSDYCGDFAFVSAGDYTHASVNSLCIAFETSRPAKSHVEYGTTDSYGSQTVQTTEDHFLHVHYITGLSPSTNYHYRIVATDTESSTIQSADRQLSTVSASGKIAIPGALSGPPYVLTTASGYYYLTSNITCGNQAIRIDASGVTVDLNGFTITYDNSTPAYIGDSWDDYAYNDATTQGIRMLYDSSAKIVNGTIVQGDNCGTGFIGIGFNPIYLSPNVYTPKCEIAGMTIEYRGNSVTGIHGGNSCYVHHNVITDSGTVIDNRSQGIKAIYCDESTQDISYNLIKRCRHNGIRSYAANADHNEIFIDSWATNSFGISPGEGSTADSNKIFGTGYHAVGIGWSSGITVSNNLLYLVADTPSNRSPEYGEEASVEGIRLTQYTGSHVVMDAITYSNNTIIVKGRNGSDYVRGIQLMSDDTITNVAVTGNKVKAIALDAGTTSPVCIACEGTSGVTWQPVLYTGNTLISNILHISFGDPYATGGNHRFRDTTLTKLESRADYHTLRLGYWTLNSYGNVFIDTVENTGTDVDDCSLNGTGTLNYTVGHSLWIVAKDGSNNLLTGHAVTVTDNTGTSFTGTTDAVTAKLKIDLWDYTWARSGGSLVKSDHSAHSAAISGHGTFTIDAEMLATRNNESTPETFTFT